MPRIQSVTIRVPASTSNLGPGFDCLGVALRLYNSVIISRSKDQLAFGERQAGLPAAGGAKGDQGSDRQEKIVTQAAKLFFTRTKRSPIPFSCSANEQIPRCRGLGSSATIRLAVLHGLNELTGRSLDRLSIFRLASELEGHPDNAAPASFGGFTVVRSENVQRFEVSSRLKFVLLIPDFEIQTAAARRMLPPKISRTAAVQSAGNAAAIAAAFASHNYEKLRDAFVDQLHQPFRTRLIPFLPRVISAAEKAGALGAFLSGSGSTICAVTLLNPRKVAAAMQRAATGQSKIVLTTADDHGLQARHSSLTPVRLGLTRH